MPVPSLLRRTDFQIEPGPGVGPPAFGGGFGDDGVHNVLEAAVYGKPVVFGPVYDRYIEAVELVGSGGGFSIENALEAEELFKQLIDNKEEYHQACEASREYVYSRKGATEKILRIIQEKRLLTN